MENKVKVEAMEALRDIQSGLGHVDLMAKYGLSHKGLRSLLHKLEKTLVSFPKPNAKVEEYCKLVSDAVDQFLGNLETCAEQRSCAIPETETEARQKEIIEDLRAGMTNDELMEKHRLSRTELRDLFEQLANSGTLQKKDGAYVIPNWQIPRRHLIWTDQIAGHGIKRRYVVVSTLVYDAFEPEVKGQLAEVAGHRILTKGIGCTLHQPATLVVQSEYFRLGKPLVFDAKCDWVRPLQSGEPSTAEFTITNMADCVQQEFLEFIELLTFAPGEKSQAYVGAQA
jgi:hypothetical protein